MSVDCMSERTAVMGKTAFLSDAKKFVKEKRNLFFQEIVCYDS